MILLQLSMLLLMQQPLSTSFTWGPDSEPYCGPTKQCADFQVCIYNKCQCQPNYNWSSDKWGQCEYYQCQNDIDCFVHDSNHVCNKNKQSASCECRAGYVSNTSGVYCHKSSLDEFCDWESDCSTDPYQTCDHTMTKCSCRDGYHAEDHVCRPGSPDQHRDTYWYIYVICLALVPIISVAGCYCWRRRTWRAKKHDDNSNPQNYPRQTSTYQEPPTLNIPPSPSTYQAEPQQTLHPFIISHPFTNINYPGTVPVQFNEPPPSYDSIHSSPLHQAVSPGVAGVYPHSSVQVEINNQPHPSNQIISHENIYENLPHAFIAKQHTSAKQNPAAPVPRKMEQLNMQL